MGDKRPVKRKRRSSPLRAKRKGLKVIDSCTCEAHLKGARRYVNNFFRNFSTTKDLKYFELDSPVTYKFYLELLNRYEKRYKELSGTE